MIVSIVCSAISVIVCIFAMVFIKSRFDDYKILHDLLDESQKISKECLYKWNDCIDHLDSANGNYMRLCKEYDDLVKNYQFTLELADEIIKGKEKEIDAVYQSLSTRSSTDN